MNEREKGANVEADDDRRARLERYLLGELDEASRQAVREEAIVNPDVYAELREIELDLLDAAARGTLAADRSRLVREQLIAAEHNRDAWALAQALAAGRSRAEGVAGRGESVAAGPSLVDGVGGRDELLTAGLSADGVVGRGEPRLEHGEREALTQSQAQVPDLRPTSQVPSRHRRAVVRFAWLSAAALVAWVGIVGYGRWRSSADRHDAVPSGPASTARRVPADIPLPAPPLVGNTPGQPPSRGPASTPSPDVPTAGIVAVYFPAATLRGSKPVVRVGSSARVIQIAFEIEAPTISRVAVAIRAVPGTSPSPGNDPLWSADDVPVRSRDGARTATIRVPASLLPSGAYEASVAAVAGETGVDRTFPFVVRRE